MKQEKNELQSIQIFIQRHVGVRKRFVFRGDARLGFECNYIIDEHGGGIRPIQASQAGRVLVSRGREQCRGAKYPQQP